MEALCTTLVQGLAVFGFIVLVVIVTLVSLIFKPLD